MTMRMQSRTWTRMLIRIPKTDVNSYTNTDTDTDMDTDINTNTDIYKYELYIISHAAVPSGMNNKKEQ